MEVVSQNIQGLNGKKMYQVHLRSRSTYTYIDPVYVTAYSDDEAWEKALDLEAGKFQVKSVSTDWMDEKVLDEEAADLAERFPKDVHQRSYITKDSVSEFNPKYAGSEAEKPGKAAA